ncbi:MAG: hypothetical protein M1814_005124 [Vezdaea aestivalis]|nr:MAG: hypothetical protein M1814_005124 [Vezdaea aestivalis]
MSGSAVLEYGFPSTHTTNAVSVAVYAFLVLKSPESTIDTQFKFPLELLCGFYATSIIAGRLYCGMHGFFDVLIGGLLGFVVSWCQWFYGGILDDYLYSGTYSAPLTITLAIIALVRIHPEPADNCPCFDDSVAFAGVLIGIEFGNWHYARSGWAWDTPVPATVPFTLADIGWVTAAVRIGVGVLIVFAWREMMKPSLLNGLPPLFRLIEQMGLDSPRRFFMQASEYKKVPSDAIDVDNVIPPISEIPSILQNIRHPRKRSVSVGPQSAADAYEALAYREKRRKESLSSADFAKTSVPPTEGARAKKGASSLLRLQDLSSLSFSTSRPFRPNIGPLTPPLSKIGSFEHMSGTDSVLYTPVTPIDDPLDALGRALVQQKESKEDQQHEREIFSLIEKPRVRYDVEVVTKLIVYAGIALLAVEINPVIFELVGLGIPAGSSR